MNGCTVDKVVGIYRVPDSPCKRHHTIIRCTCGKFHINLGRPDELPSESSHGYKYLAQVTCRIAAETRRQALANIKRLSQEMDAERLVLHSLHKLRLSRNKS